MDYIGRKWALMVGCVVFIIGAIVQTIVPNSLSQCTYRQADAWD